MSKKSIKTHPIFVYGILQGREDAIEGTVKGYRLIDMGSFPAAVPCDSKCTVGGELIYVDDNTLEDFDRIEGAPSFYKREKVFVGTGNKTVEAEMYVVNKNSWKAPSIRSLRLKINEEDNTVLYRYHP